MTSSYSISYLALLVVGCGGGAIHSGDPAAAKASKVAVGTYPVTDLPGEAQCWMGETISDLKGGQATATRTLTRRSWEAATSMVREESAVWIGPINVKGKNAIADYPPQQRSASEYKLEGASAKFTSKWKSAVDHREAPKSGTLSGTVTFTGDAGKWTAWQVDIDVGGGTMLKVTNTVGADKGVTFTGGLFDVKGKKLVEMNGELAALDAAACKDEFSKVPPF